jgi:hypothetical protein
MRQEAAMTCWSAWHTVTLASQHKSLHSRAAGITISISITTSIIIVIIIIIISTRSAAPHLSMA